MVKSIRKFNGKKFVRDSYMYAEWKIGAEADQARKRGYRVRRVKGEKYKSGTGNWWHLYTRKVK